MLQAPLNPFVIFCRSVCVAFSILFSIFNNRMSETIYDTKTRQSKNRMYCLCKSFLILFFSFSFFLFFFFFFFFFFLNHTFLKYIKKNMIVTQSFCVPKVLKRATKHESRFTHRNCLKLCKEQFKFKPQARNRLQTVISKLAVEGESLSNPKILQYFKRYFFV